MVTVACPFEKLFYVIFSAIFFYLILKTYKSIQAEECFLLRV